MPAGKFKVSNSSKKEDQAGEKHRERAALVWTAVEQLVRFADVAQIPLIGGAFGLLGEVITALNVRIFLAERLGLRLTAFDAACERQLCRM